MALDYKELGFKCGLEIHQRLDTKTKLFCRCSTDSKDQNPIMEIERYQRAVAGETGLIDRSTSFESSRKREFRYKVFRNTTCLVDIDEEPPHSPNKEAIGTALRISAYVDADVPDEIQPMRKEVLDGSDPSAFQRSMMVAYGGKLQVGNRLINIPSVFLEEESSGIEDTKGEKATYRTDRLGIPLIEVDTDPSIANPAEAKEVAKQIGLLLRLSGRAQRGIGSIRQDVNVSIKRGTRVEIKGLQELDRMDSIIEKEVERQRNLVEIMDELNKRKASVGKPQDITKIFKDTKAAIIDNSIKSNGVVLGAKLNKFKGIVCREINEGKRLGTEISEYTKKGGVKGIIHSDENLEKYGLTEKEAEEIRAALKASEDDAFILIAAEQGAAEKSMGYALLRAGLAISGVPPETRNAEPNSDTTRFMRPLPGGSRMYPETDILPISIDPGSYAKMKKEKLSIQEISRKLEEEIGNKQLSDQMLWSHNFQTYNYIKENISVKPNVIAGILLEKLTELRRKGIPADEISAEVLLEIFKRYEKEKITRLGIEEVLKLLPKSPADIDRLIKTKGLSRFTKAEVEEIVRKNKGKDANDTRNRVMSKHRINVDGEELNSAIKKAFGV